MANIVGTLNLLQSVVDHELELEKFDTAGTSRSTATCARPSRTTTTSTRRLADPARALADQPEVDLRDREGRRRLPDDELPRRLRRPGRRHAHVQQLRPAPEPALRDRHDHHPGARARASSSGAGAAARLLLLHGRRPRAPDGRRARHPRRRLRLRPGQEHLDGRLGRPDPPDRRGGRLLARPRDRDERRALPPGGPT